MISHLLDIRDAKKQISMVAIFGRRGAQDSIVSNNCNDVYIWFGLCFSPDSICQYFYCVVRFIVATTWNFTEEIEN